MIRSLTTHSFVERGGKSARSIIEKLVRQPTLKLSQMQDIAGCRVVLDGLIEQDALTAKLQGAFMTQKVIDRRARPSHDYRAVHIVPTVNGERYEIQIRTSLQHDWAQLVERLAGEHGQEVKYGGGAFRDILATYSADIARLETCEAALVRASWGDSLNAQQIGSILSFFDDIEDFSVQESDAYDGSSQRLLFAAIQKKRRVLTFNLQRMLPSPR